MGRVLETSRRGPAPGSPATVLGRAGALAGDDHRVAGGRFGRETPLQDDLVLPAVSEVILIGERVSGPAKQVSNSNRALVSPLRELSVEGTVVRAGGKEVVQVRIGPSHDALQAIV